MSNRSRVATRPGTLTPLETGPDAIARKEDVELALVGATEDIRFRVAKAVRGILAQASNSAFSKTDQSEGPTSIKTLADVLRNAATLVDSLHDLARAEVLLSHDVGSVVSDVSDMIEACRDFEALRHVNSDVIKKLADSMDAAAQTVEKSEEVLDLVTQLSSIELGVNNLGISREEFAVLSGTQPLPANKKDRAEVDSVLTQLGVKPSEVARVKQMGKDISPPSTAHEPLPQQSYSARRMAETAPYAQPLDVKVPLTDLSNEARAKQLAEAEAAIQALDAMRLESAARSSSSFTFESSVKRLHPELAEQLIPVELTKKWEEAGTASAKEVESELETPPADKE